MGGLCWRVWGGRSSKGWREKINHRLTCAGVDIDDVRHDTIDQAVRELMQDFPDNVYVDLLCRGSNILSGFVYAAQDGMIVSKAGEGPIVSVEENRMNLLTDYESRMANDNLIDLETGRGIGIGGAEATASSETATNRQQAPSRQHDASRRTGEIGDAGTHRLGETGNKTEVAKHSNKNTTQDLERLGDLTEARIPTATKKDEEGFSNTAEREQIAEERAELASLRQQLEELGVAIMKTDSCVRNFFDLRHGTKDSSVKEVKYWFEENADRLRAKVDLLTRELEDLIPRGPAA